MKIRFRVVAINGLKVFYREAGRPAAPTLLLLHGFPSSSHVSRDLIPLLAERYHLVAPDLPGFGQSSMPDRSTYRYTFKDYATNVALYPQFQAYPSLAKTGAGRRLRAHPTHQPEC